MPRPDSLSALERVVAKYRSDVHRLAPGAPADAVIAAEEHLGQALPPGLRSLLLVHNGASLFRGALSLRSTSELALASADARAVVLFADGEGEARWAWASDGRDGFVFGTWEGGRLRPMHGSFGGWLAGTVAVLEARTLDAGDRAGLRFDADAGDVWQQVARAERVLRAGRPEEAEILLRQVTTRAPHIVTAWQLLGDALAVSDRGAARRAWLEALRRTWLPLPWPGAPAFDPEALSALAYAFPDADAWERDLRRFLDERVSDVVSPEEFRLVESVVHALATSLLQRGRRADAGVALGDLLSRSRLFAVGATPWATVLTLADIQVDLGNHDEAEGLLRRVLREGPATERAAALVALARIAVTRQEPWAEDILDEADAAAPPPDVHLESLVLRAERLVRQGRGADARGLIEEAAVLSRRLAVQTLQAQVYLAEGDVSRESGDAEAAQRAYEEGLRILGDKHAPQTKFRFVTRLGDLAARAGAVSEAERHWRRAAEGFAGAELPVREAWVLVRLARVRTDRGALADAARERFLAADLAAGVAAADAVIGDPGRSLDWHLERATAHARARYDAQRARPPYERADADRPERRLGAHRLAVAACDERVVDAMHTEMNACVRAIGGGRGRALDPPVLRYIAAVDLLSGHRSFSAAKVLLEHLLDGGVTGPARRALVGAIARSPNAALVDGLLSRVERPQGHPAPAVAAAAEVLGLRREQAAVAPLVRLVDPGANPTARRAAVAALGRIGDRAVVDRIVPALDEPTLAEQAALALLMLGDRRGVAFHGEALARGRTDLSGSPGEIVGRYGGPAHLLQLVGAAEGGGEGALGALMGLGLLGDPRGVPTLLAALQRRDPKAVEVACDALEILAKHHEDAGSPGARARWQAWWDDHRDRFQDGVRHRDGVVMHAGVLLDRMAADDPWVRRTAYDELVITTGCALPFDFDGPWRVQQAHLRGWQRWWAGAKGSQPAGRWYLDGAPID